MEELIQYLKTTQMKGLKGMRIEGEIPVSEEQLNVLMEQFVRPQLESGEAKSTGTSNSTSGPVSGNAMMDLLPYLKFPVLKVKVKEGQLVLKVKVEV